MNQKRWRILIGSMLVLGAAVVLWLRSAEPSYQGKSVRRLIREWEPRFRNGYGVDYKPFEEAFKVMGTDAVPILFRILRGDQDALAQRIYRKIKPLAPIWVQARLPAPRNEGDMDTRLIMVRMALAQTVPESVPLLSAALKDTSARIREAAIWGLSTWWPGSEPAVNGDVLVPLMIVALRDSSPEVRRAATGALATRVPTSARALEAILGLVDDPDVWVRGNAVRGLTRTASANQVVLPHLIRKLKDSDTDQTGNMIVNVRQGAVKAIEGLGADARSAVPGLQELMLAPSWMTNFPFSDRSLMEESTRLDAAFAVWKLTSDLDLILPFLNEKLQSTPVPAVRSRILDFLAEIKPQ